MGRKQGKKLKTRIPELLSHTTRYAFEGGARLAADIGCTRSAVNRLIAGREAPTYNLVCAVTRELERELGRRIDPRDVVMDEFDRWITPNVCTVAGCEGCFPDHAYDEDDNLRPEFENVRPGHWSVDPALSKEVAC